MTAGASETHSTFLNIPSVVEYSAVNLPVIGTPLTFSPAAKKSTEADPFHPFQDAFEVHFSALESDQLLNFAGKNRIPELPTEFSK